jgi:hypothetical protein
MHLMLLALQKLDKKLAFRLFQAALMMINLPENHSGNI